MSLGGNSTAGAEMIYHIRPTKGAAYDKVATGLSGPFCVYGTNFAREYYNSVLECLVAINTVERAGDRNYEIHVHANP